MTLAVISRHRLAALTAILTWWSIVTPLLAVLIVAIGWPALRRVRHHVARSADRSPNVRSPSPATSSTWRSDVRRHRETSR